MYIRGLAGLIIGSILVSCVSTTGTKKSGTANELGKIRRAGIIVESTRPLSVRLARDGRTDTGLALFGLVGAAVEAGYNSSKDTGRAENVLGALGVFDPAQESAVALRENFEAAKMIPEVAIVKMDDGHLSRGQGFDALFKENIEEWGLRLCGGEDRVRVALDVHMRLIALPNESVIWERDEFFMDGACRPIGEFQADRELLRTSLKSAIETLAGKTVNEIMFP
jgi:hypothetical protein